MECLVGCKGMEINFQVVRDYLENWGDAKIVPEYRNSASWGGVGGSLAENCRRRGMEQYDRLAHNEPFDFGEAVLTASGMYDEILAHVVTVGCPDDEAFETVFKAVFNAIGKLNQESHRTGRVTAVFEIAIPLLGTGTLGALTAEQSARAIIGAVDLWGRMCGATPIKDVYLCILDGSNMEVAEKVLQDGSYRGFGQQDGQQPFDPIEWLHSTGGELCTVEREAMQEGK